MGYRFSAALVRDNVVSFRQMDEALTYQRTQGGRLATILLQLHGVSEPTLLRYLGRSVELPPAQDEDLSAVDPAVLGLLEFEEIKSLGAIPVRRHEDAVVVLVSDPPDAIIRRRLEALCRSPLDVRLILDFRFHQALTTLFDEPLPPRYQPLALTHPSPFKTVDGTKPLRRRTDVAGNLPAIRTPFPTDMRPPSTSAAVSLPTSRDVEQSLSALEAVLSTAEDKDVLLSVAASFFGRFAQDVALYAIHRQRLRALVIRREGERRPGGEEFVLTPEGYVAHIVEKGSAHLGPGFDRELQSLFASMGRRKPIHECFAISVVIGKRTVLLVVGASDEEILLPERAPALLRGRDLLRQAMERLLAKVRGVAPPPTPPQRATPPAAEVREEDPLADARAVEVMEEALPPRRSTLPNAFLSSDHERVVAQPKLQVQVDLAGSAKSAEVMAASPLSPAASPGAALFPAPAQPASDHDSTWEHQAAHPAPGRLPRPGTMPLTALPMPPARDVTASPASSQPSSKAYHPPKAGFSLLVPPPPQARSTGRNPVPPAEQPMPGRWRRSASASEAATEGATEAGTPSSEVRDSVPTSALPLLQDDDSRFHSSPNLEHTATSADADPLDDQPTGDLPALPFARSEDGRASAPAVSAHQQATVERPPEPQAIAASTEDPDDIITQELPPLRPARTPGADAPAPVGADAPWRAPDSAPATPDSTLDNPWDRAIRSLSGRHTAVGALDDAAELPPALAHTRASLDVTDEQLERLLPEEVVDADVEMDVEVVHPSAPSGEAEAGEAEAGEAETGEAETGEAETGEAVLDVAPLHMQEEADEDPRSTDPAPDDALSEEPVHAAEPAALEPTLASDAAEASADPLLASDAAEAAADPSVASDAAEASADPSLAPDPAEAAADPSVAADSLRGALRASMPTGAWRHFVEDHLPEEAQVVAALQPLESQEDPMEPSDHEAADGAPGEGSRGQGDLLDGGPGEPEEGSVPEAPPEVAGGTEGTRGTGDLLALGDVTEAAALPEAEEPTSLPEGAGAADAEDELDLTDPRVFEPSSDYEVVPDRAEVRAVTSQIDHIRAFCAEIVRDAGRGDADGARRLGVALHSPSQPLMIEALVAAFPGPLSLYRRSPDDAREPLERHGHLVAALMPHVGRLRTFLMTMLSSSSDDVRYYALRLAASAEDGVFAVTCATTRLLDSDSQTRHLAWALVEETKGSALFEQAMLYLRRHLQSTDLWTAEQATAGIAHFGDVQSIPVLIDLLTESSDHLRDKLRAALVELTFEDMGKDPTLWRRWYRQHRDEDRMAWLAQGLTHSAGRVREVAARALRRSVDVHIPYDPHGDRLSQQMAAVSLRKHVGLA